MFQITRHGVTTDPTHLDALRSQFAQHHYVMLPRFLEPSLLTYLLRHVEAGPFVLKVEADGAEEFGRVVALPSNNPSLFAYHLMVNRPALFRAVEYVTGCPPIGNFLGRIHRSLPGGDHHIDWHGDTEDHRLVGLNLNLSPAGFSGGAFQMRYPDTERLCAEIANVVLGDAFLFRISPMIQHRLTPLEGEGSRTVAVGWFRAQPEWSVFSRHSFHPQP